MSDAMQTDRPTTVVPMSADCLWTMLRSYLESITGDASGRIPEQSSVSKILSLLEVS